MLTHHAATLSMLENDKRTAYLLRDYFDLPRATSLVQSLTERGLGQADIVLALSRFHNHATDHDHVFRDFIERFIGHPIIVGPSCLTRYRDPHPYIAPVKQPRISYVAPGNPRLPNSGAFYQWSEYKLGRTVNQLLARGITRRDIRRVSRRGWIKLETT